MSQKAQVSNAFEIPAYTNILFNTAALPRNAKTSGFELEKSLGAKKKSFKSINLLSKPESSIENNLQKIKGLSKVDSVNMLAIERKLKRKSFFEHICGGKTTKTHAYEANQKINTSDERMPGSMGMPTRAAETKTECSKRNAASVYVGAVYGSTSTVDSSDLSIDRMMSQKLTTNKPFLVNLNIKKVKLAKNTNCKPDFVCLTDHIKTRDNRDTADNSTEKRFPNTFYGNKIFEIEDELLKWDGKCVDLDEKTLMEVLSKSSH